MTNPFSPQTLLRPEIADMEEYVPIQPFEVLSQRLGIPAERIVKLDANENPYGPLPAVAEALAEYPYYHIYPDPQQTELRAALSSMAQMKCWTISAVSFCNQGMPLSTAHPPLACIALTPVWLALLWSKPGVTPIIL